MSTRPAPRPRPRPRPRAVTAEPPSSSPGASSTPLPVVSPLEPVNTNIVEDEDALFFKNNNRTNQTWRKLTKLAEESEVKKPKPASDDDGSEPEEITPRKKHKKSENSDSRPAWTKADIIILSSSDEEEDELLARVDTKTPRAKNAARDEATRRIHKRQRSRSRSVTPPPALASITVMHARETVARMLGPAVRSTSPTGEEDDSDDNIELDPELAVLARTAKIEVQRQLSSTPAVGSRSPSPIAVGGPEEVIIKVRWRSHPLNPDPKRVTYEYRMRRNDSFDEVFEETADEAGVLADHLIISYEGKRIFPSASPHGIGVWDEAVLEGCDKITYDYIRTHREATPEPTGSQHPARDGSPRAQSEDPSETGSGDKDDDKMKLTFRSAASKPITLTVRPTTKCSVIVKAFLKRAGLADKITALPVNKGKGKSKGAMFGGPALMVDGDRLDPDAEIGSADLEDGDLVEVVGL